jgi:hypothetical protein
MSEVTLYVVGALWFRDTILSLGVISIARTHYRGSSPIKKRPTPRTAIGP